MNVPDFVVIIFVSVLFGGLAALLYMIHPMLAVWNITSLIVGLGFYIEINLVKKKK